MDVEPHNILKGRNNKRPFQRFLHLWICCDRPYKSNGQFNWESQTVYLDSITDLETVKNKAIQRKQRDQMKPKAVREFYKSSLDNLLPRNLSIPTWVSYRKIVFLFKLKQNDFTIL
jgi:hypothetical protein